MPATKSADEAGAPALREVGGCGGPRVRQVMRMRAIAGEEVAHDLLGPAHDAHDAGMAVDPFEQERLEACNVERSSHQRRQRWHGRHRGCPPGFPARASADADAVSADHVAT